MNAKSVQPVIIGMDDGVTFKAGICKRVDSTGIRTTHYTIIRTQVTGT